MGEPLLRELALDNGGALALRVWEATGPAKASVVIGPAMGAPQSYYGAYATWLAEQGYRVWTFDFRGHGESRPHTPGQTLRGFRADLMDWTSDYEAVVRAAKSEQAALPLYLVGHSLGAQLPGLFMKPELVDGLFSVAAGSGYWRENAPRLRRRVLFLWHVVAPLTTGLFGYFPGRRLRMISNLPAGVMRQWRRWCLHPRYSAAEGAPALARYAQVQFPVLAWTFSDDEMMTLRGTHSLLSLYTAAPKQVSTLTPQHLGVRRIGHFGMFRESFRDTLWPRTVEALESLPGLRQRTDALSAAAPVRDEQVAAP